MSAKSLVSRTRGAQSQSNPYGRAGRAETKLETSRDNADAGGEENDYAHVTEADVEVLAHDVTSLDVQLYLFAKDLFAERFRIMDDCNNSSSI